MDRDIRDSDVYRDVEEFFRRWLEPGFGRVTGAAEPSLRPDGRAVAVTGTVLDRLEGLGHTRIAVADGDGLRLVTGGPGHDRCPTWSPDGSTLAFLSDRAEEGVFGLYLLRDGLGEAVATPRVDGTVEYCAWSPDGGRILLGVAGLGADLAGGKGSGTNAGPPDDGGPAWLPVTQGGEESAWRSAWVHDLAAGTVRPVSPDGLNVWEAAWLGPDRIAAVASDGDPGEGAWYTAALVALDVAGGGTEVVYKPQAQLGWPAGSPGGRRLAVVEALSSDRWIVAGDLRLVDVSSGAVVTADTGGVDVTGVQWLDDRRLGYVGVRGLDTVAGTYDTESGIRNELLATDASSGPRYPEAAFAPDGSTVLLLERYDRPPAVTLVSATGKTTELAALTDPGAEGLASVAGTAAPVRWTAPDGLEIEGVLCRPAGDGPFPLVVLVHGGPVWAYRNRWRMGYDYTPLLVSRGFAVLHPNPRGSSGRGQEFAGAVFGDMGGADTHDILSGVDDLVARGIADPARLGVTGGSYGGFMSCWLVSQDRRFAAAVPVAPVTNWYSQHLTSNIGHFDALFLDDDPYSAGGRYHERSPVMHARAVRTPTLLVAGARDRCTPPTQAAEFHTALRDHGVETELVVYPEEGHGVRRLPARIDLAARMLGWFERHLSVQSGGTA